MCSKTDLEKYLKALENLVKKGKWNSELQGKIISNIGEDEESSKRYEKLLGIYQKMIFGFNNEKEKSLQEYLKKYRSR